MAKKRAAPRNRRRSAGKREKSTERAPHAARSRAEFQAHKFSLSDEPSAAAPSPEPSPPKFIPWGYGRDRVTALAVDPERLYVYWEVTDEARERATAKLGTAASQVSLHLRVYDTTGRLFDGTNAHSHFDQRVDDGSRQWFFDIGKAGSEAFVEIGMKSQEGGFARIARSGRVVFPRRSPAPFREPRWLTVEAASSEPPVVTRARDEVRVTSEPVSEDFAGEVSTLEVDGRPHITIGPWQVVIRDSRGLEERRVLSRWTVYLSWAVERMGEGPEGSVGERMIGSSALHGASERFLQGASERRYVAASERLLRGGSERRLGGASGRR